MKYHIYIFIFTLNFLLINQLKGQEYKLIIQSKEGIPENIQKHYKDFAGDSLSVQTQLKLIIENLKEDGYLAASVDSLKCSTSEVYVYLNKGFKYAWGTLAYNHLDQKLKEDLRIDGEDMGLVNLNKLNKIKDGIIKYYENSGYPFVSVNLDSLQISDSIFNAKINVDKGQYYFTDSIIVKGEVNISPTYIKKTLQINKGDAFNQSKINKINKRIGNLNFLSELKPAEIEFSGESVDLYLYLQKKKANVFNGIIGFLPESEKSDGKSGKLNITGELKLGLVNPFGKGEEILLNWEKLESSTQKLDLGLMYPYIFKTNLGLDASFGLYKKDSSYLSLNTVVGLRLFLMNGSYVKAYYRYKSSTKIGSDGANINLSNYADIKSNIFGASYYISEVDYKYNPRKGIELDMFAGAGTKKSVKSGVKQDSLNSIIDTKTLEIEAGLNLNVYFPIYNNFIFHFGNTTRYLDYFGDNDQETVFYENELYRFGGARSLRGFDESIFLASIYSMQSIEIKYLLDKNSAFYAFWNGAYYYKNISQTVTEDFPWGFGIGLDFDTRAGVFSLSYALGKQFDNPFEIRTAKIHFGYISRF